MIRTTVKTDI